MVAEQGRLSSTWPPGSKPSEAAYDAPRGGPPYPVDQHDGTIDGVPGDQLLLDGNPPGRPTAGGKQARDSSKQGVGDHGWLPLW
jgi:hypothetical protein